LKGRDITIFYVSATATHLCTVTLSVFFFPRENAGLLALTRVGSRRVVQISAGFMIFFSILGEILMPAIYETQILTQTPNTTMTLIIHEHN
jgi:hypothetical protein